MSVVYLLQSSFATGEISPSLYGRPDLAKYSSALRRCENFIIHPHGGISKRPGMKFIAKAKGQCRLVSFEYSLDQTYILEFGNKYVRFYRDGQQITTSSGSAYQVTTSYALADLSELKFAQSADVLYIVHQNYPPAELYRVSDTEWILGDFDYGGGPWKTNSADVGDITVAMSATSGTVTLTASDSIFESGHVGSLFSIVNHVAEVSEQTSGNASDGDWGCEITAYGDWRLESNGFWGGTVYLEYYDADESDWKIYKTYISTTYADDCDSCENAKNYSDSDTVDEPTKLRIRSDDFTQFVPEGNDEADAGYFLLVAAAAEHRAIMKITAVSSGTKATARVLTEAANTKATVNWEFGAWSDVEGYPSAVGFYQERLVFGATTEQPQTWWMSCTADYYNFETSFDTLDDESITGTLVSRKMFAIKHFISLDKLIIFTTGNEWKLSAGVTGGAVTPSSVEVSVQGNRGCSDLEPIVVGNMVLFTESRGLRVRDLGYQYSSDSYTGVDITVLARHLFEDHRIVDWAWATEPDSMCWVVRDDGALIALTYLQEQEVIAWARFPTDGTVESVAAVSTNGPDLVYFSVVRNGTRCIEVMQPAYINESQEGFFVDSGVTVESDDEITEVSGLDHLEGLDVVALADGDVIEGLTVSDGTVQLPYGANKVHVGLPYEAVAETLDLILRRQDGTQLTRKCRISSATLRVDQTRGLLAGTAINDGNATYSEGISKQQKRVLYEMPERSTEEPDFPTDLLTQDFKVYLTSKYDSGRVLMYAPFPLPCTVLALISEVDAGG